MQLDSRQREWPPEFNISHLPAGDYRLEHHLDDNRGFETYEYVGAWGAQKVTLLENKTTNAGNISQWDKERITVDVVDSDGNALIGKELRIKDRLYESWVVFTESSDDLDVASSYPLQKPPAWQLDGDLLTIDSVRNGWIEFELVDELGCKRELLIEVPESGGYRVAVPTEAN